MTSPEPTQRQTFLWLRQLGAVLRHLNPLAIVAGLWGHRELIHQLTLRQVQVRFRGSFLGLVWVALLPLSILTIYTVVFSGILEARFGDFGESNHFDFALTLFAGLIVFEVFAGMLQDSPTLVTTNPGYVKKVIFPLQVLPVVHLYSLLIYAAVSLGILAGGLLYFRHGIPVTFYQFPLIFLPLIMFSLGVGWFVASLGVFVPDIAHATGVAARLLFFVTPVFYPIEKVPQDLLWMIHANPLATWVEQARRVMIWNQPIDWAPWGVSTAVALGVMLLGYAWFMETRRGFADVL